jgi:hypothetical protein
MGRKRSHGNTTPHKINNNIIEDLVKSEGDESPVADLKRMMTRMLKNLAKHTNN